MEVHFTTEQQARLVEVAGRSGKDAEEIVREAVARMLEDDANFVKGVKLGIASLDRGEFVEHQEVKARVDRLLRS
jgi:predicted transcriptional regulator